MTGEVTGMRERAQLYGGTLSAGPGANGGFAVTLTMPVPATAERDLAPPVRTLSTRA